MNDIITVVIVISIIVSVVNNILKQRNQEQQRRQGQSQPVQRPQTPRVSGPSTIPSTVFRTAQKEQEVELEKENWQKKLARKIQEIQKQMEMPAEEFPPFPRPKTVMRTEATVKLVPVIGENTSVETAAGEISEKTLTTLPGLYETEKPIEVSSLLKKLNLTTPGGLQEAVILSEILGPPKSLRRSGRYPGIRR